MSGGWPVGIARFWRWSLVVLLAGGGCGSRGAGGDTAGEDSGAPREGDTGGPEGTGDELRVVTLNTHSFQEGDDSLDKLAWIGEGLATLEADLVGLQEVMSGTFYAYDYDGAYYDGTEIVVEALEAASGRSWHTAVFGFAHWDTGEEMANVVLSRYPILDSGSRALTTTDFWPAPEEQRNVGYVRVEVPGLGLVNFFVTHTWGWDSADTEAQIDEVKAYMADRFQGDEALDVLVGDLNVPATSSAYTHWLESEPFRLLDTWAQANPHTEGVSTTFEGDDRIDYILAGEGWTLSEEPACQESWITFDGEDHEGVTLPVVSDHKGVVTAFDLDDPACTG